MTLKLNNIFTEYDNNIERLLHLDPLGLGIIWTHFGQRIFKGKISSSVWDVRNLNINLFNHYIVKKLMDDGDEQIKELFYKNKKETIEKLLIILENMVIWSWHKDNDGWERKNLLGTAKAINLWGVDHEINIDITANINDLELLIKQKSTGINGSYKGSFISMGFFDSNYNEYFDNDEVLVKIKTLIEENVVLNRLYNDVIKFFRDMQVKNIPIDSYKNVFAKTSILAKHTQKFWESNLGFTAGEAGELYEIIDTEDFRFNRLKGDNFKLILNLEPKLSYLDALFNYLLYCDGVEFTKIEKKYLKHLNRLDFGDEIDIATEGAKERLIELNNVIDIESLITYHSNVMESRDYSPCLKIEDKKLVVEVKSKEEKEKLEKKLESCIDDISNIRWLHQYYIPSLINLKKGFNDETL